MVDVSDFKPKTARLYTNCPECNGKMSIPLVTHLSEIVGTTPGCPSCGKLLFCVPPGKLILFDDNKHKATAELPVVCKECRGHGFVRVNQEPDPKVFVQKCELVHVTCSKCKGDGRDR